MGSFELRCRLTKVPTADFGIRLMAVLEGEGLNGFIVTELDAKSEAAKWLKVGDRIVYTNGIPALNFSKLMEGVTHKMFLDTVDCQFFRYIPMERPKKVIEKLQITKLQAHLLMLGEEWTVLGHAPECGVNLHDIVLSVDGIITSALKKSWQEILNGLHNYSDTLKLTIQRGGLHSTVEKFVKAPRADSDYFHAYFRRANDPRPLGLFVKEINNNMIIISMSEPGTQGWGVIEPLDRIMAINEKLIVTSAECGVEMNQTNPSPFRLVIERPRTVGRRAHLNKLVSTKLVQPSVDWPIPPPAPDLQLSLGEVFRAPELKKAKVSGILKNMPLPAVIQAPASDRSAPTVGSTKSAPTAGGAQSALTAGSVRGGSTSSSSASTSSAGSAREKKTGGVGSAGATLPATTKAVVGGPPAKPQKEVAKQGALSVKRAVNFSKVVNTTEIFQDVEPKMRKC